MDIGSALLLFVERTFGKKAATAAKAIVPAFAGAVAVLTQYLATGVFDQAELATALMAAGGSILTFWTANKPTEKSRRELAKEGATFEREERKGEGVWSPEDEPADVPGMEPGLPGTPDESY